MQREPVMVTKNNRPVGIMISIHDAADTLIPELFMEKEAGYDEWFTVKVTEALGAYRNGTATLAGHDEATDRVWKRVQARSSKT